MNKPIKTVAMATAVIGSLLLACSVQAASSSDFAGFWEPVAKVTTLKTVNGEAPPLKAEAKKAYEQHQAAAKKGDRSWDNEQKCLPIGMSRLMAESPFELMVAKKNLALIFEWNHFVHLIDVADKQDKELTYPYYVGHSVAQFKGDAWNIDTIYFNDDTVLDASGLPHSDALHITQTLQLKDANTLENTMTIEDSKTFTKSWQTKLTYKRMPAGAQLKEDVCVERLGLKKLDTSK